jgi:hypothetical protein
MISSTPSFRPTEGSGEITAYQLIRNIQMPVISRFRFASLEMTMLIEIFKIL